jgi:hypothetical protein
VQEQGGPGFYEYVKGQVQAMARGEELEPDTTLMDEYFAVRNGTWRAMNRTCRRCGLAIAAGEKFVDAGPLGVFHQMCWQG